MPLLGKRAAAARLGLDAGSPQTLRLVASPLRSGFSSFHMGSGPRLHCGRGAVLEHLGDEPPACSAMVTDHGPHLRRTPGTEMLPARSDISTGCEATLASPASPRRSLVMISLTTRRWRIIPQLQSTGISRTNKPGVPRILRALRGQFSVTFRTPTDCHPRESGDPSIRLRKVRVGSPLSRG